jgi:aldehyde dehydrogenase (NAD+)
MFQEKHHQFIGGTWRESSDEEVLPVFDPSTGQKITEIAGGNASDVDAAVMTARQVFETTFSRMSAADRSRLLYRYAQLIAAHREELAQLESMDVGKPISLARIEIDVLVRSFEFYAGAADKIHGEVIPFSLGVAAIVVPWNGPAVIFGRAVAAALCAGNCCVVKPAEEASLTILRLGELSLDAGVPPGVINIVTGRGATAGQALISHAKVDHISFTGSPEIGTLVQSAAAVNHVPVTLELGGKSPNIVFADADLDRAAASITAGITINSGQVCAAGSRVLIERSVYEPFLELLVERFSALRVGAASEDLDLGPLVTENHWRRVARTIERAKADGLTLAATGTVSPSAPAGGYFQVPTLFRDVDPQHYMAQDEIFGPVLCATPFEDEADAIRIANSTNYGLVAGVWTRDGSRQLRMAYAIRAGQVHVNTFLAGRGIELPFGGMGKSGHGREKGLEALHSLTRAKTIVIDHGGWPQCQ